ncbi:hypothetical protein [Herbiconiux sp. VKM Ac-2851]|uniref:hypothetical protein n=1 Tax=Herbiconiux sp. VKM Ac-2851 TaxID=2739025 RepID=UPI001564566C|nr:hypothetical protein [Herbiconiux sp. VKM Ac-2851]NQX36448.1 hypothetical protein [Herbiconiux sp. VKM Ac-2851]
MAIAYTLASDSSGGVTIDATSNLPDGSELNASLFVEDGFLAQDQGVLNNGHISFGPFSNKGTPLRGSYDLSITLPIARNQPGLVQACIGDAGQNLTGVLVSTDEISGDKFASLDAVVVID